MKVLADLVDHAHGITERHRGVLGQHGGGAGAGIGCVPRAAGAVDAHPARLEQTFQQMRGLLGRVLDSNSQRLCPSIERSCTPNANQERTGLAAQAQLSLRTRRAGDDLVLHPVGIHPGFDSVPGGLPFAFGGAQLDVERVVVHGDGADRRPIPPGCVFQRPSRRVAIVLKIAVISDDVAVDLLNAAGDYGISQLRNDFLW